MGPEFNNSLQKIASQKLDLLGYKYDGKRRFIKIYDKHKLNI